MRGRGGLGYQGPNRGRGRGRGQGTSTVTSNSEYQVSAGVQPPSSPVVGVTSAAVVKTATPVRTPSPSEKVEKVPVSTATPVSSSGSVASSSVASSSVASAGGSSTSTVTETPPRGAITPTIRRCDRYFESEEAVSASIQSVHFERWEDSLRTHLVSFGNSMAEAALDCVHGIHREQREAIVRETQTVLEGRIEAAVQAKVDADNIIKLHKRRMEAIQAQTDQRDIQFMGAFGVEQSDWDGTIGHARHLLDAMERSRAGYSGVTATTTGQSSVHMSDGSNSTTL
jgi:hypothetical protein